MYYYCTSSLVPAQVLDTVLVPDIVPGTRFVQVPGTWYGMLQYWVPTLRIELYIVQVHGTVLVVVVRYSNI